MNPFIEKLLGNVPENPEPKKLAVSNNNKIIIGKIYAEWCGHCIALAPKWKTLLKTMRNKIPKKQLVIVNIESENVENGLSVLNEKYLYGSDEKVAIQGGYPTIFKIVNGKIHYFEGPREVSPMLKWAMEGLPRHTKKNRSAKNKTRKMRN
jgi:thiol-disulfide isomerase/thioredoxin